MKKPLVVLLALLGVLALFAGAALLVIAAFSWMSTGTVASKTILEIDFESSIVEYVPDDPIAQAFQSRAVTTREIVEGLERAAKDDRVVGVFARVGAVPMGLAQIQEFRDAVMEFRKSKKPAVAFGETFGEFGPGNGAYYLATAFDAIWLQPSGDVGLNGLMYESQFVRGTLDKLGVVPRMDHRYEYKNAMNFYTEKKFTEAHREALEKVMRSQFGQIVRGIAAARKMSEAEVRALADKGPYLGKQAQDAKLVDGLAYRDEALASLRRKVGDSAKLLYLPRYVERAGPLHDRGKTIALVYGVGGVQRGSGGYDPIMGSVTMGSDTVASALRAAAADADVRAILFRVDSPGGSYVASDTIWREVQNARKAGKPVVVSMGNLAGSGGYFVAMGADKIVAEPGTITGSIGVLGGKLLTTGLWDKLGLSFDEVHTSENADMFTSTKDYSPQEWDKFEQWLDRVYADFTSKVAEGRHLPRERVLEIAKGRIWSGEDAKGIGLVDELGGFPEALRLARQAAGMAPDEEITLKPFPKRRTAWEALTSKGPDSSEPDAWVSLASRLAASVRPWAVLARRVGLTNPPGALTMDDAPEPR